MGRKKYSKELKARIALGAIKGQEELAELASEDSVHANQIISLKEMKTLGCFINGKHELGFKDTTAVTNYL